MSAEPGSKHSDLVYIATRYVLGTGPEAVIATKSGGNLAVPLMAEVLGGGPGTTAGDLLLAVVSAIAFATILAVVSEPSRTTSGPSSAAAGSRATARRPSPRVPARR